MLFVWWNTDFTWLSTGTLWLEHLNLRIRFIYLNCACGSVLTFAISKLLNNCYSNYDLLFMCYHGCNKLFLLGLFLISDYIAFLKIIPFGFILNIWYIAFLNEEQFKVGVSVTCSHTILNNHCCNPQDTDILPAFKVTLLSCKFEQRRQQIAEFIAWHILL